MESSSRHAKSTRSMQVTSRRSSSPLPSPQKARKGRAPPVRPEVVARVARLGLQPCDGCDWTSFQLLPPSKGPWTVTAGRPLGPASVLEIHGTSARGGSTGKGIDWVRSLLDEARQKRDSSGSLVPGQGSRSDWRDLLSCLSVPRLSATYSLASTCGHGYGERAVRACARASGILVRIPAWM